MKFLGMPHSGGGMWSAICVFMLLLDERIFTNGDCIISLPAKSPKHNVFFEAFTWVEPKNDFKAKKSYMPEGQRVTFFCRNGFVDSNLSGKMYSFVCQNGKYNDTFYYEDLLCKSEFHKQTKTYIISSVQLGSDIFKCEGRNRELIQVGIEQPDGQFKPLYMTCFDRNVMRPKFTYQPPRQKARYTEETSSRWDVWGFDHFGSSAYERLKLSDGYVAHVQKHRLTNLFSDEHNKKNPYPHLFTRGHLANFGDFPNPEERKATCLYINAAPQLKHLNLNTWMIIEYEIKLLLKENPEEWEVYTGTYGTMLSPKGPLFLSPFFDANGKITKAYLPVPKVFWKFIRHLKNEKLSRVFVGVNNPKFKTLQEIPPDYLLCKPVPRGGKKFRGSADKGFAYECHIPEFLAKLAQEERIVKEN